MKIQTCKAGFPLLLALVGCSAMSREGRGCEILGPEDLVPPLVGKIHLGMSRTEVEEILGAAAYSPVEGQYYYPTAETCPVDEAEMKAPCGVVAEFRRPKGAELEVVDSLEDCWWGAIGE